MEPQKIGKTRNAGIVFLLGIITLGIYIAVWYYKINKEIKEHDPAQEFSPGWATVAFFIPFANLFSAYNTASRIKKMQKADNSQDLISPVLALILFILLWIGYIIYVQGTLNDHWYDHSRASTPTPQT